MHCAFIIYILITVVFGTLHHISAAWSTLAVCTYDVEYHWANELCQKKFVVAYFIVIVWYCGKLFALTQTAFKFMQFGVSTVHPRLNLVYIPP